MSKTYYKSYERPSRRKQKRMSIRRLKQTHTGDWTAYAGVMAVIFDRAELGDDFDAFYDRVIEFFEAHNATCTGFGMDIEEFEATRSAPEGKELDTEIIVESHSHADTIGWAKKESERTGSEVAPWADLQAFFKLFCAEPYVKRATMAIQDAWWDDWSLDDETAAKPILTFTYSKEQV